MLPSPNVLAAWSFDPQRVEPVSVGLINRTYIVHRGELRYVLQRLNAIFGPEVNKDIQYITRHLKDAGVVTPMLEHTISGDAWLLDDEQHCWRALTYVEGRTYEKVHSPAVAHEAGKVLGRFHRALAALDYRFAHTRSGVHDTPKHLAALTAALQVHGGHSAWREVNALAQEIFARAHALPDLRGLATTIVHGDPKISNVLFDQQDRGVCLVDLDTMAYMPVALELGDALRSWTNPHREDEAQAAVDMDLCAAALQGYGQEASSLLPESALVADGFETICLELAARFAADALNESYFGWDSTRYASASAHNLARARAQYALAASARKLREAVTEAAAAARLL